MACTTRSARNDQRLIWFCALAVCAFVSCWQVSSAHASILLPDAPEFNVDEYGSNDFSGSGSGRQPAEDIDDHQPDESHLLLATDAPANSNSSGNSSSSGGVAGGSSPYALGHLRGASDLNLVGWVTNPARFALPMPPGTDLLRPPQCRIRNLFIV